MKRLVLLMLGALTLPACAATRSQLVATWEPEPDVIVSYKLDLGDLNRERLQRNDR